MGDKNYMDSALVIWVQTFSVEKISYYDLIDGVYLNEVYQQIDKKSELDGLVRKVEGVSDKLHNWEILLKNLKTFFHEVLQQYVVLKPPDVCVLCYQSDSDAAKDQLDTALLLLLGCAVQCDDKEAYIEVLKSMPEETQHHIMSSIKEVTDTSRCVLDVNFPLHAIDASSLVLYTHLNHLLKQRETFIQENTRLHQTLNNLTSLQDNVSRLEITGRLERRNRASCRLSLVQCEMANMVGQAEYRAVLRRLKQDIMDKGDTILEMEDEVDVLKKELNKLKNNNYELTQQVRQALHYRDELDIYKEKANQTEKLESELQKCQKKLSEVEGLRERVDELNGDNCLLMERTRLMEEQVEKGRQKLRLGGETEVELIKCKRRLDEVLKEQDEEHTKMRMMTTKMEQMQKDMEVRRRVSYIEDSSLNASMVGSVSSANEATVSLGDQLLQASQSQILHLESRLQRMQCALDEKALFSEKFMMMFEIGKEEMIMNNGMGGERTGKVKINVGLLGDESGEESWIDGKVGVHEAEDLVIAGDHGGCRDLVEKKVMKYVSELQDQKIELLERIKTFDQDLRDFEESNSKLTNEKCEILNQKSQIENKYKRTNKEKSKLESEVVELKKSEDVMGNEIERLKETLKEVEKKKVVMASERDLFEEEVGRLRVVVKERNSRLDEMNNVVVDLKSDLESFKESEEDLQELQEKTAQLEDKLKLLSEGSVSDKQEIGNLREELVKEKLNSKALCEDLTKAKKRCESFESGEIGSEKFKLVEVMYAEKSLELTVRQEKIRELEKSLDGLRLQVVQLQSELNNPARVSTPGKDRTMTVTQRFSHSSNATQEILSLKAELITAHRIQDTLKEDNDKLRKEMTPLNKEIVSLKNSLLENLSAHKKHEKHTALERCLEKSQNDVASLQVDLATSRMHQSALDTQVAQMKVYLAGKESDLEAVSLERRSLEESCRSLQKFHDRLGVEHERVQEELVCLKGVHRLFKTDLKAATERIAAQDKFIAKLQDCSSNSSSVVADLREQIERQRSMLKDLEEENNGLCGDMRRIKVETARSREALVVGNKQLDCTKSDVNELRLEVSRLRRIEKLCERMELEKQMLTDQLTRRGSIVGDNCSATTSSCDKNSTLPSQTTSFTIRRYQKEEIDDSGVKSIDNSDSTLKKKIKKSSSSLMKKTQNFLEKRSDSWENSTKKETHENDTSSKQGQDDFVTSQTATKVKSYPSFESATMGVDWRKRDTFLKSRPHNSTGKADSKASQADDKAENETITLNQFLAECNQSPKARRKFLVKKQVELGDEDDVFQTDEALKPKSPVLFHATFSLQKSKNHGKVNGDCKLNQTIRSGDDVNNDNGNKESYTVIIDNAAKKSNTSWFDRLRPDSKMPQIKTNRNNINRHFSNNDDSINGSVNGIESKNPKFSDRLVNLQKSKRIYKNRLELEDVTGKETSDVSEGRVGSARSSKSASSSVNGLENKRGSGSGELKNLTLLSSQELSYEVFSQGLQCNRDESRDVKMVHEDDEDGYTVGCGIRRRESSKNDSDSKRVKESKRRIVKDKMTDVKQHKISEQGQKVRGLVNAFKMPRPFSADVKKNTHSSFSEHSISPSRHNPDNNNISNNKITKNINKKSNFGLDKNNNKQQENDATRDIKVCLVRPATASTVVSKTSVPTNQYDESPQRASHLNSHTNTQAKTLTNTNTPTNKYTFGVNCRQKPFHEYGCF